MKKEKAGDGAVKKEKLDPEFTPSTPQPTLEQVCRKELRRLDRNLLVLDMLEMSEQYVPYRGPRIQNEGHRLRMELKAHFKEQRDAMLGQLYDLKAAP